MAFLSVSFRVFVPFAITTGWAWAPWPLQDPVGDDRLDSLDDLPRLLRTYARSAAMLVRPRTGDRFNVTAFGARSGRAYGRDVWVWDPEFRVFRASGQPWVPGATEARQNGVQRASVLVPADVSAAA